MIETSYFGRVRTLGLIMAAVAVIGSSRLFYLQVIKHDYYRLLASEEQLRKFEVSPRRGDIYLQDRGQVVPVAMNRELKRIYADPRFIEDIETTAAKLADKLKIDKTAVAESLRTESAYVIIKRQVDPKLATSVDELGLAGVGIQDEPVRVYPEGSLAAQALGFVNQDGQGQYGVEEALNSTLAGGRGLLKATTDTRGIPIATSDNFQIAPRQGDDVVLTIDRNIQAKVEAVLAAGMSKYNAKSAGAVIVDPNSGAILAMASNPTFVPSDFAEISDYSLFNNQVSHSLYEPGSVMKIFTMAAGLDSGVVTPQTTYQDSGFVRIDDRKIENARGIPTGIHSMDDVIAKSINTGVIFVLERLGGGNINNEAKVRLSNYFHERFGFGTPTGIDLQAEPAGFLPPTSESNVGFANLTFGQGMNATMLQVVAGYSAIVNGGTYYRPYLVDSQISPDGKVSKTEPEAKAEKLLPQATINQLKNMLRAVVEEGGGVEARVPGYLVGGKSGTAQIPNPAGGYYTNRDIGSFVGTVPLGAPQFVVMVRIDEPQIGTFASAAARPMVGEIMKWLVNYRGVTPQ